MRQQDFFFSVRPPQNQFCEVLSNIDMLYKKRLLSKLLLSTMMPFSPEFLREMAAAAAALSQPVNTKPAGTTSSKKLKKSASSASITSCREPILTQNKLPSAKEIVTEQVKCQSYDIFSAVLPSGAFLVGFQDAVVESNHYISGFCKVTALKGCVVVNGYELANNGSVGNTGVSISCPIWQPAYVVSCSAERALVSSIKTPTKSLKSKFADSTNAILAEHGVKLASNDEEKLGGLYSCFQELPILFVLEGIQAAEQEWLIAAEDLSAYNTPLPSQYMTSPAATIVVEAEPPLHFTKVPLVQAGSAMFGTHQGMHASSADCMTLPPSWAGAAQTLVSAYHTKQPLRAVVCGAKGVGKSTCLKYVANSLLSSCSGGGSATAAATGSGRSSVGGTGGGGGATAGSNASRSDVSQSSVPAHYAGEGGGGGGGGAGGVVCLLDCDLGQPELSVSGTVSLHVLTCNEYGYEYGYGHRHPSSGDNRSNNYSNSSGNHISNKNSNSSSDPPWSRTGPLLSAAHLDVREADTSYFLGDVTSKYEPTLVLEYIRRLVERYHVICREVAAIHAKRRKEATKSFVASNSFNALLLDSSSSSKKNSSIGTAFPLPLLINLDGYVKNMGAEVMESIIRMVDPTHAMHICSAKDRHIVPLEQMLSLNLPASENAAAGAVGAAGAGTANASLATATATATGAAGEGTVAGTCSLLVVEPGRFYTVPRVAAVDLRNLRTVAYFLRADEEVRRLVRPPPAPSSSAAAFLVTSSSVDVPHNIDSNSSRSSSGGAAAVGGVGGVGGSAGGVCIRNGAIVDPLGLLALRLVSLPPLLVPFAAVALGTLPVSADVPPRLLLAAMNGALVGIMRVEDTDRSGSVPVSTVHVDQYGEEQVVVEDQEVDLIGGSRKRLKLMEQEFDLSCLQDTCPPLLCCGIGVVRAVDIPNQRIVLTTPFDVASSPHHLTRGKSASFRLCLLKGNNFQLPSVLSYAPTFPCFPYLSSESAGEGAATLRTRNNVKRRGQQV
jgi:hypothetical protein